MFTGIVEEVGRVLYLRRTFPRATLRVLTHKVGRGSKVGDSVAVNGVCLTVARKEGNHLVFYISHETLKKTTLGSLRAGEPVNLERAVEPSGRLGGHILQGHIDTTTKLASVKRVGEDRIFTFRLEPEFSSLVVEKGSIGVDGVSLTVAGVTEKAFSVVVIPYTYTNTNFKFKKPGNRVNVEFDIVGKYIHRFMEGRQKA